MSSARIIYIPRLDANAETEAAALAAVYKFLLDRRARHEAAGQDPQSHVRKEAADEPLKK